MKNTILLLTIFGLSGCLTAGSENTGLINIQSELNTTKVDILNANEENTKLKEEISKLKGEIDRLTESVKKGELLGANTEENSTSPNYRITLLEKDLKDMRALLGLDKLDFNKGNTVVSQPLPKVEDVEKLFKDNKYKEALSGAKLIVSETTDDVKLLLNMIIAESSFQLGDYQSSALLYDQLQTNTKYAQKSKLRIAQCFDKLGDLDTAKLFYEDALVTSAESEEGKEARKALDRMSKEVTSK